MSVCGKGNVIKMNQKKSIGAKKHNAKKTSIKKIGLMLGASVLCVATIATIGAMSVIGNPEIISTNETVYAETQRDNVISGTIEWKKASINEYDLAAEAVRITTKAKKKVTTKATTAEVVTKPETQATTKAVTTKKAAKTTKKATKKTTSIQAINSKTMYVREDVNFRTGPSKSYGIIKVLVAGKKVTVVGKTNDGWYKIKVDGTTGFCMQEYLTTTAPAKPAANNTVAPKKTNSGTISYTNEEFNMLCYVLQNEAGGCSDASKIAVANVIINRVKSPNFQNSLSGVLTAPNQFTAISNYYSKSNPPTQSTINCARRALNGEDNSNGAVYYYAPRYCGTSSWFESLTFCMELEGQRFFR